MAELLGASSSEPLVAPVGTFMPVGEARDADPRAQARAKARKRRQKIRKENSRRATRRAAGESDVSSDLEVSDDTDDEQGPPPGVPTPAVAMVAPSGGALNKFASTGVAFEVEGSIAVVTLLQHNAPSESQGSESLLVVLEECRRRRGQLTSIFLWVGTQPGPPGLALPGASTAPATFNPLLSRDSLYAMIEGLPQLLVGFTDFTTTSVSTCLLAACDLVVASPRAQELQLTADSEEGYLPLCLQQRLGSGAGMLSPFSSSVDINQAVKSGLVDEVVSPVAGSLAMRRDELQSLLQGNPSCSSGLKKKLRSLRGAHGSQFTSMPGPGPPPGPPPLPSDVGAAFASRRANGAGLDGSSMVMGAFLPSEFFAQERENLDEDAGTSSIPRAPAPGLAPPMNPMTIPCGFDMQLHPMDGKHMDGKQLTDPNNSSTALMICNIPCSITKQQLEEAVDLAGFAGQYEYIYVPEKRRSRKMEPAGRTSNPGYGFISFSDASRVSDFVKRFTGYKFQGTSSSKVVEVRPAKTQCSGANLRAPDLPGAKPPPGLELLWPPPGVADDGQGLPRWGPVPASGYPFAPGLPPPVPPSPSTPPAPLAQQTMQAAPQAPGALGNALASLMDLDGPRGPWMDPIWPPGATQIDRAMPGKTGVTAGDDSVEFGEFHAAPGQATAPWPTGQDLSRAGGPRLDAGLEGLVGEAKPKDPSSKQACASMPDGHQGRITALMICNVPCSASQQQLAEAVDSMGFGGKYSFLYLPVKGRSSKSGQSVRRSNLGYGFIDFPDPEDAKTFMKKFAGYQFAGTSSMKRCEVRAAHEQGSAGSGRSPMPFPGLPGMTALPSSSSPIQLGAPVPSKAGGVRL